MNRDFPLAATLPAPNNQLVKFLTRDSNLPPSDRKRRPPVVFIQGFCSFSLLLYVHRDCNCNMKQTCYFIHLNSRDYIRER